MTTNQTIDGVPRELLERIYRHLFVEPSLNRDDGKKLRALLDAPAENVIDVSAVSWDEIQKAASESTWMPPEYMRNDWVDDVCRFLREGPAAQPQGEPVAWQLTMNGEQKEIAGKIGPSPSWENLKRHGYKVEPLYAEQPAPVAVTPSLWEICVRDEPGNPESPCEYLYASSVTERDSILRRGGASVFTEYTRLDEVTRLNTK